MRFALRVAAVLTSIAIAAPARADRRRLAVVGGGASLDDAVSVALSPWDIDVVPVDARAPSADVAAATRDARSLAATEGADAVAWLRDSGDDRTLWLYDRRDDQVITRAVTPGAIDDAAAAAIALSLKTLLRASTVAPEQERLGGRDAARAHGPGLFRLELDGGARLRATEQSVVEPRVGIAVAWWPRPFDDRIGIALRLEEGTGFAVHTHELTARYADHALGLGVRARAPLGRLVALEPALGGALHLTTLAGGSVDGAPPFELSRVDAAVEASLGVTVNVARWAYLGARAGATYWMRWQRYDAEGASVLTVPPLQASVALVIGGAIN